MFTKSHNITCIYLGLALTIYSPLTASCNDDLFADFEAELNDENSLSLFSNKDTKSTTFAPKIEQPIPTPQKEESQPTEYDIELIAEDELTEPNKTGSQTPPPPPPSTKKRTSPQPKLLDTSTDLLTKLRTKKEVSIYDVERWVMDNPQINRCYEHGKTILLFMLSETTNIEGIEYLINQGADLTTHCIPQYDALFYALKHNTSYPVIETLIENNANLMYKDGEGNNALIISATQNPNPKILQTLLEYGLKATEKNNNGFDALTLASYSSKNIAIHDILLDNGADINATDEQGHTPLMAAAVAGHDNVMQYLIRNGANYKATDKNGLSVLDYYNKREYLKNLGYTENKYASPSEQLKNKFNFIAEQHFKLEKKLKDSIYKKNATKNLEQALSNQMDADTADEHGCTTLLNASQNNNNIEIFEKLMLFKANTNATCHNGKNALMFLSQNQNKDPEKQIEKLKLLSQYGIDFNHKDDNGDTPLIHALNQNANAKFIKTLIELGSDPNITNKQNISPLWIAIQNNTKAEVIQTLLEQGADGNTLNTDGNTPLWHYIKNAPTTSYIKATTYGNSNINAQQKNGDTPLIYVIKNSYSPEIIQVIIEAGANAEIQNNDGLNAYDILRQSRYFEETVQKKTREHVLENWN